MYPEQEPLVKTYKWDWILKHHPKTLTKICTWKNKIENKNEFLKVEKKIAI